MEERKMLAVLALVVALQCVSAMFFHAPSGVNIQALEGENNTDFGFSMAYMKDIKTLVVGAPKANKLGKIFNCEIHDAKEVKTIECQEQFMTIESAWYNTEQFPKQRFHLGASIVARNDSFFTCAPLWTAKVNAMNEDAKKIKVSDTFGTCFAEDSTGTHRFRGLLEDYVRSSSSLSVDRFNGGTGWSTLIDEDNDMILITKTATKKSGDIYYVPASKPYSRIVRSLNTKKENLRYLTRYWNIGFGITAGKFFKSDTTMYAFSVLQKNMEGLILFLSHRKGYLSLFALTGLDASKDKFILLNNNAVGAMFGATLSAADLNMDGLDELLVGAPAHSEDDCVECGALHIYVGGDKRTLTERKRMRSIYGNAELGRFGTAIAAKDLDGDGKPELVVSAPYEDNGSGTIYILSGYEVHNTLMKSQDYKSIQLSELKLTQKIHKKSYRALGFSLQFVTDVDDNACDDLAASSPGNSTVLLFKCVQKINVTLSSHLVGQPVREQDQYFTVEVCVRVVLPPKLPKHILGNITVENSIVNQAAIVLQPNITIDITCFTCQRDRKNLCENVTVKMTDKEPADYSFISKAVLQNYYLTDSNMTEFNSSWVETSPYSTMDARIEVSRHCKDDDCNPDLSMNITWSGSDRYVLGSSAKERVKIHVTNVGNASYSSCVWLKVTGAPLTRVGCRVYQDGYTCDMPKPLRRDTNYDIDLQLDMTKPTNEHEALLVEVHLYENCNQETVKQKMILEVPFDLHSEGVFNDGDLHRLNITDKQILDKAKVYDHHEYPIRNNGTITWKQVNFTVSVQRNTHQYINSIKVTAPDFGECDTINQMDSSLIMYRCVIKELPPNTTHTIIGTTEIFAGRLNGLVNGAELNMTSTAELLLSARVPVLKTLSNTRITIQEELTLGTKKWLIALIAFIVALILLIILTVILYKCGFFRRKQKQNLLVAKESVRRKSIRRDTHASAMDGPAEGLQMDVDDDCPFEEARPVTTKDNVGLVIDDER